MSIQISQVFDGLVSQQILALIGILKKGQEHAKSKGIDDQELIGARLTEDMHPLLWQVQTALELITRGAERLMVSDLHSLELNETNFDALIARVESVHASLKDLNAAKLDASSDMVFVIPIGPEAKLTLTGRDYVLKFLLPNVYFHITTAYALLRMNGVDVGKRDYMGPF